MVLWVFYVYILYGYRCNLLLNALSQSLKFKILAERAMEPFGFQFDEMHEQQQQQ